MTAITGTPQEPQVSADEETKPPLPSKEASAVEKIRSGRLYVEIGDDYLLWGLIGRKRLKDAGSLAGAFTNSHLGDPAVQAEYLNEILASSGLQRGTAELFLSLPDAMLRSFYVPVVPANELKQIVLWEAAKVFPFSLQDEPIAWKVVNTVEWSGTRKHQIQAAAVPSAKITPICELLMSKEIAVRHVTLTALTWEPLLSHLASSAKDQAIRCAAVVRLLGNRLEVFCFHRGNLEFVRENTIELSDSGGEFEASLRFFDGSAPVPLFDPAAFPNVDPHLVSRMVLDSLDYYYGRFTQRTVDTIVLAVQKEHHAAIAEALRGTLGVPVTAAFEETDGRTGGDALCQKLLLPATCSALHRRRPLDLLPAPLRISSQQRTRFRISLYAATLSLLAALLVSAFQFITLEDLSGENRQLQMSLDGITGSVPYQQMVSQIGEQTQWQTQLAQLRGASSRPSRVLKALSAHTPQGIYLTGITLQAIQDATGRPANSVSIAGFVGGNDRYPELRLAEYLQKLKGLPACRKVQLNNQVSTISSEGARLEFSLAMEFDR